MYWLDLKINLNAHEYDGFKMKLPITLSFSVKHNTKTPESFGYLYYPIQ